FSFITDGRGSKLILITTQNAPIVELTIKPSGKDKQVEEVNLKDFIDIKGWKSIGNKLCGKEFAKVKLLPPPKDEDTSNEPEENEDDEDENIYNETIKEEKELPKLKSDDDKKDKFTSGDQISLL
ncbi:MAG: hypothetical protein RLZZ337_682, partial [Bacteroidota bacterium]